MTRITANPGSFLEVEGRLSVVGERVMLDDRPLDELIRSHYLQELEHRDESLLRFGPTSIVVQARPRIRK